MTLAVQCVMIVQGALYLGDNASEPEAKAGLNTLNVWEKALSLIKNLSQHLSSTDPTLDTLQTEYNAFLDLLKVRRFLHQVFKRLN